MINKLMSIVGNGNIQINGKSYQGNNISIVNGKVVVDGVIQDGSEDFYKCSEIIVNINNSTIKKLDIGCGATINGDVHGNIDAGNGIRCGDVYGDVDAGNSVNCGNVSGDVDEGNSIKMKK